MQIYSVSVFIFQAVFSCKVLALGITFTCNFIRIFFSLSVSANRLREPVLQVDTQCPL